MKRPAVPLTADGHRKELVRLLRENAYGFDMWSVFQDWIELSAIAISNAVDWAQRAGREARYMQIVAKYNADQAARFARAMAHLVAALECAGFDDILGRTFMELELGNKWAGQFFTPYCVASLMARTMVDDQMRARIAQRGFITASDPCVGGGAMPIGLAHAMHDAGLPYQQCLHVTAVDVDSKSVHMAYLQLSYLHVPAVVVLGNSLALEEREHWYTPAHILGGWTRRLWKRDDVGRGPPVEAEEYEEVDAKLAGAPAVADRILDAALS